ncbi:MAG: hypothetical protein KAW49_13555, partial [Anaerolineae bacterium]|nr:hypothetical protein [Anaerolineae bacterium]
MNSTQRDTHPAPDAIWSTELRQPPAGPLLVVGDLLLVPTQEPSQPFQHSTLHALSLVDGSPRWQHPFEHALVSGLASTHTPPPPHSPTPTLPHFPTPTLILVATSSTDLLRGEGALVALDAAGEEQWRWSPGVQRVSAPVISSEVRSDDFSRP